MNSVESEWILGELAHVELGDGRLNDRLMATSILLAANPEASIGAACGTKALTKGAYRMFANPQVDPEEILDSHRIATSARLEKEDLIFAIQDTTALSYDDHNLEDGFGIVARNGSKDTVGLFLHTNLAVDSSGSPVGMISQTCYSRPPSPKTSRKKQKKINKAKAYDEKESKRWIDGLHETARLSTKARVITLCDRESDIFEFIETANRLKTNFIVRACRDRLVETGGRLFDSLSEASIMGIRKTEVPIPGTHKHRTAQMEIRCIKTSILPPKDRGAAQKAEHLSYTKQEIYIVEAKEINAPDGLSPLHWMLLTNIAVSSFEQACQMVDYYKLRWSIELFHRVLKSGCKVEEIALETANRVKIALVLYSIIAVRLLALTMAWRAKPEACCTEQLSEAEWKTLLIRIYPKKPLPKEPPSLEVAIQLIARLGGFIKYGSRKPGMTVIWRGWRVLQTSVQMYEALALQQEAAQTS